MVSKMLAIGIVLLLIFNKDVIGIEEMNPTIDDEDYSGVSSGSGAFTDYYSDHSLHHELANLTSNGLINVMTDMILPSIVRSSDLVNISIIGHENPTVNCDNAGGIHFDDCHIVQSQV